VKRQDYVHRVGRTGRAGQKGDIFLILTMVFLACLNLFSCVFSRVPGERSSACSLKFKLSCAEPVGIAWTLLTSEDGAAGRSIAPWPFGLHSVYACHIKDQQISNGSNPGAILSASNCVKTKLAEAEIFKRLICKPETAGESVICCQCQRALIYSNSTHEIAWPVTGCGSSTFGHLGLEEFEE